MRPIEKACVAVTLAAAVGLKEHGIKLKLPALKQKWTTIGSSTREVRLIPGAFDASNEVNTTGYEKHKAAEGSLRMVIYLSCWGPY
ncbi:hypothetical protein L1049_001145 [Liquidambar formosana]|uniref:Uncharacterized protein n=1 Tax=Liquidambar formosana TaxID=63359 RepID=A0AAP0R5G1_LIQFO